MDNTKDDKYYIQRIKKDLEFIVVHMQNVDIEELNKNEVLLDSMLFRMIQVSENAKKLSDEIKEKTVMFRGEHWLVLEIESCMTMEM